MYEVERASQVPVPMLVPLGSGMARGTTAPPLARSQERDTRATTYIKPVGCVGIIRAHFSLFLFCRA